MSNYAGVERLRSARLLSLIANFSVFVLVVEYYLYYLVDYSFLTIRIVSTGIVAAVCLLDIIATRGHMFVLNSSWFVALMVLSWGLGVLAIDEHYSNLVSLCCSVSYFFIAQWFVISKKCYAVLYEVLYYVVCCTILFKVYILQIPISSIIQDGSSYNYISVIALFFFLLSSIIRLQDKKSLSLFQTILLTFITITGYGRAGILVGYLLLIMVLIYKIYENKKNRSIALRTIAVSVAIFIVVLFVVFFLYSDFFIGKFMTKGLFVNDRLEIWVGYFTDLIKNPIKIFFGGNVYALRQDGNLHNSFLQMHAQFGLIFTIVNMVLIVKLIRQLYRSGKVDTLILLVVFLLRCFTDRVMYHGVSELVYCIFINMLLTETNMNLTSEKFQVQ